MQISQLHPIDYLFIILFFFFAIYLIQKEFNKQEKLFGRKFDELESELEDIRKELNELRDEMEYQNLTEAEKEEIAFEKAKDISINFFEKLEKGQIISLISGSYYYPSENIFISNFEYKHDHIDKENKTQFVCEVHGYEKVSEEGEWSPCTFLANETECSTSSCSGTIKKR